MSILIPDMQRMEYLPTACHTLFIVILHIAASLSLKLIAFLHALWLTVLVVAAGVSSLCMPSEKTACKHGFLLRPRDAHFAVTAVGSLAVYSGVARRAIRNLFIPFAATLYPYKLAA